jgi:hypothetical protein
VARSNPVEDLRRELTAPVLSFYLTGIQRGKSDGRHLVPVVALQHGERFSVIVTGMKGFFLIQNAEGLFQLTDPPRYRVSVVTEPGLTRACTTSPVVVTWP